MQLPGMWPISIFFPVFLSTSKLGCAVRRFIVIANVDDSDIVQVIVRCSP